MSKPTDLIHVVDLINGIPSFVICRTVKLSHPNGVFFGKSGHKEDRPLRVHINETEETRIHDAEQVHEEGFLEQVWVSLVVHVQPVEHLTNLLEVVRHICVIPTDILTSFQQDRGFCCCRRLQGIAHFGTVLLEHLHGDLKGIRTHLIESHFICNGMDGILSDRLEQCCTTENDNVENGRIAPISTYRNINCHKQWPG